MTRLLDMGTVLLVGSEDVDVMDYWTRRRCSTKHLRFNHCSDSVGQLFTLSH